MSRRPLHLPDLLADVLGEVCRHLDISESASGLVAALGRWLPVQGLVRRSAAPAKALGRGLVSSMEEERASIEACDRGHIRGPRPSPVARRGRRESNGAGLDIGYFEGSHKPS